MENTGEQFDFGKFIYLCGGLFLVMVLTLVLKLVFPPKVVNVSEMLTKIGEPVSLDWNLLRKPLSINLPILAVDLTASPQTTSSGNFIDLVAEVKGVVQGPFVYRFDCQGDGVFEMETEPIFQKKYIASDICSFDKQGDFTAKATVDGFFDFYQNSQETKEKKTVQATVALKIKDSNVPPVFSFCDVDNVEGTTQVNFKFNFTSQAKDPNGDEIKYEWDFGDGNKSLGQNVEYGYQKIGLFVPKVKAIDSKGDFSECVARSLTVLKGLSSFQEIQIPKKIGRINPFIPPTASELMLNEKESAVIPETVFQNATSTNTTTTNITATSP